MLRIFYLYTRSVAHLTNNLKEDMLVFSNGAICHHVICNQGWQSVHIFIKINERKASTLHIWKFYSFWEYFFLKIFWSFFYFGSRLTWEIFYMGIKTEIRVFWFNNKCSEIVDLKDSMMQQIILTFFNQTVQHFFTLP